MASGTSWRVASVLMMGDVQFATAVVPARLSTPAGFGTAALAMVLVGAVSLLTILNVGPALVQRQSLNRRFAGTARNASLATWVTATLTVRFLAPGIVAAIGGVAPVAGGVGRCLAHSAAAGGRGVVRTVPAAAVSPAVLKDALGRWLVSGATNTIHELMHPLPSPLGHILRRLLRLSDVGVGMMRETFTPAYLHDAHGAGAREGVHR